MMQNKTDIYQCVVKNIKFLTVSDNIVKYEHQVRRFFKDTSKINYVYLNDILTEQVI